MFFRQRGFLIKIRINTLRLRNPNWRSPEQLNTASFLPAPVPESLKETPFGANIIERVAEAETLLRKELQNPLTIATIAQKVGLNTRTLQAGFKYRYGQSIIRYRRHLRLEHARILLRQQPDLSLQEIAEACGYSEHTNLGAAFKKRFDMSLSEWRRVNAI